MKKSQRNYYKGSFFILPLRFLLIIFLCFLITSTAVVSVSYSAFQDVFRSTFLYQTLSNYKAQSLYYLMNTENHHFSQAFDKNFAPIPLSSIALQLATNIRAQDARSLFGSELPGFSIFDSNIILAGQGTDYTNIPHESSPSLDKISGERDLAPEENKKYEESQKKQNTFKNPDRTTGDRKVVYIYHTHSWESYLPLLGMTGDKNADNATDNKTNITLVGDMIGKDLESQGIGTEVDKTNMTQKLNEQGWKPSRAYNMSRTVVEAALQQNKDITYLIDIHRDALRGDKTTAQINGKSYAKIMFVLGEANPNFEQNLKLAKELHQKLEEKYPGLSRGVLGKRKTSGNNGLYNQDLSNDSILIEVGGVDNNMEELTNTANAFSDVFSEVYWKAEKVNAN